MREASTSLPSTKRRSARKEAARSCTAPTRSGSRSPSFGDTNPSGAVVFVLALAFVVAVAFVAAVAVAFVAAVAVAFVVAVAVEFGDAIVFAVAFWFWFSFWFWFRFSVE